MFNVWPTVAWTRYMELRLCALAMISYTDPSMFKAVYGGPSTIVLLTAVLVMMTFPSAVPPLKL